MMGEMTMVERVIAAIGDSPDNVGWTLRQVYVANAGETGNWFDEADFNASMEVLARAAIKAMRLPTEAMREIGWQAANDGYCGYEQMIDTALAEEPRNG